MDTERTEYDLGDLFRRYGLAYEQTHPLCLEQRKAIADISRCRTSMLGGHIQQCSDCGHQEIAYNSCSNRNCPKCQGIQQRKWVKARLSELLPIQYFHAVFTIAQEYHDLLSYSSAKIYGAISTTAAKVIKKLMKKYYGAEPGIIAVLHTWGQKLQDHPHVHMIITGGGLSLDKTRWIHCKGGYLLDIVEVQEEFKVEFAKEILKLHKYNQLRLNTDRKTNPSAAKIQQINDKACAKRWNVHIDKPFAGPERVLEYAGRYTHCVAIRNSRIKYISDNGVVSFDYKDYKDRDDKGIPKHKTEELSYDKFMGRFLRHVLPKGFRKVRMYGIFAGGNSKEKIELCKSFFPADSTELESDDSRDIPPADMLCPVCKVGIMTNTQTIIELERAPPEIYNYYNVKTQFSSAA